MRRALGMKPHSRVEFVQRPDGILIRPAGGELPEYIPELPPVKSGAPEEIRMGNTFDTLSEDPE